MTETELCERYLPLLRAVGRRRLRDRTAADELAQETLAVVIAALREGRVERTDAIGAYVLGVARNLIREGHRRERRSRALADALAPLSPEASAPPHEGERDARLRRCFMRLTPRAREILERALIEEQTAPEIAEALRLSAGNVRVIRHRALAEVRRCLQTGGEAS